MACLYHRITIITDMYFRETWNDALFFTLVEEFRSHSLNFEYKICRIQRSLKKYKHTTKNEITKRLIRSKKKTDPRGCGTRLFYFELGSANLEREMIFYFDLGSRTNMEREILCDIRGLMGTWPIWSSSPGGRLKVETPRGWGHACSHAPWPRPSRVPILIASRSPTQ